MRFSLFLLICLPLFCCKTKNLQSSVKPVPTLDVNGTSTPTVVPILYELSWMDSIRAFKKDELKLTGKYSEEGNKILAQEAKAERKKYEQMVVHRLWDLDMLEEAVLPSFLDSTQLLRFVLKGERFETALNIKMFDIGVFDLSESEINQLLAEIEREYKSGVQFEQLADEFGGRYKSENCSSGWTDRHEFVDEFTQPIQEHKKGDFFFAHTPQFQMYFAVLKTHEDRKYPVKIFAKYEE